MIPPSQPFAAIILAADRGPDDPIANAARMPGKCLVPVANRPMVLRVLDTLEALPDVDAPLLCGPAWSVVAESASLLERIRSGRVRWMPHEDSPSRSASTALRSVPDGRPVLLTTADHALLTPAMLVHFLRRARTLDCDVAAALASAADVRTAFPGSRRTVMWLRDGGYCGCNLFAFLTSRGRDATLFWQRVEAQRKRPWRIARTLGWRTMLAYALGTLRLPQVLEQLSERMQMRVGAVRMPFAEAAVDVDTEADLALAERILSLRRENGE
ncbi:MAG: NTP transferase domain-containing protein [Gammaproteobacteria bacterium]|nr:NTP transferase domain-containing protein [Gammaproteobacteria bacterium]NIR81927.1 NTP transferase domain-containing protein [Gammaproteobacteria bacterium]NIR88759.1 NTP transferase domain-containing protein [Gammaproteobacteria bacterium]NIU03035.1 NTP transferase domain-containing protein [Gammaproteobacteria bacterium]NIV50556.1 NTP transferase domain-containing protein [Gammaproteobacteria bacterium]